MAFSIQIVINYKSNYKARILRNPNPKPFRLGRKQVNCFPEKSFIGETTGNWLKGDIHLGFNISRVFSFKKSQDKW